MFMVEMALFPVGLRLIHFREVICAPN
jgi:hypothetical protein